ncbi:MAG: ABC transporter substrate-binding protein [Alphaproteobacteria bacterium]|jgi:peptide/nickel transport system substrate-binding protein|nr:ABC transporter substrate-binding protein [Alphaproteobacteria bacterium]MDP6517854.1 ABC transporter substrate-binding protein [Alphaproteobacteria bacterium]
MRRLRGVLGVLGLAALLAGSAGAAADSVLRIVPHADLKNTDPIWTTAYITRNHGYMVYDTLFALDETLSVRPQMVESTTISADGLSYRFTLRDGLRWHDGAPVTAADCVASIRRWGARDGMGQKLLDMTAELAVEDDRSFRLVLSAPYGLVLESLGKISSNVPFMMPARLAATDPFEQVTEITGSGPFTFVHDEWVPGAKVVYARNRAYRPRDEPPSLAAGGKVAKVDRVEWLYIPDPATAVNALVAGEVDYFELPPVDLVPILEAAPGVEVAVLDPLGVQGWLRLNHLHPPFDHPKAREAVLWLIDQTEYMQALIGDPEYWRTCPSVFGCGVPFETDIGSAALMGRDVDRAKALLAEAGYDGTAVVLLQATDIPVLNGAALVTAQALRAGGIAVEVQAMDWSTLTSRRVMTAPPEEGGWNLFLTWAIGADVLNPVINIAVSGGCRERAWFGWPCDPEIEGLRDAFARAPDSSTRHALAEQVQARAYRIVTHAHYGQWFNPVGYRDNLHGLIRSPVQFFWNIEKR